MQILHSNKIEAKIDPLIGELLINDDIKTEKRTRLQQFGRSRLGRLGIGAFLFHSFETTIVFHRCVQSCETREGAEKIKGIY